MLITLAETTVDAEQWTGTNDDVITRHLGRDDWREVAGVVTQPGWWLFRCADGSVGQMSDKAMQARRRS